MVSEIQELEGVQKAFTARISGMKDIHYWDLLQQPSLLSLQCCRERYIIIHMIMWKVLHGVTTNDLKIEFMDHALF